MSTNRLDVFKKRFRELVGDKTLTQFEEETGIKRQTAGFFFNGEREPRVPMLRKICEKCNVSADWLIGLSDVKKRDIDAQAICKKTGLSEAALSTILLCKDKDLTDELNYVLEYGLTAFLSFLGHLHDLKKTYNATQAISLEEASKIDESKKLLEKIGFYVGDHKTKVSATIQDCTVKLDELMRSYIIPPETREAKQNKWETVLPPVEYPGKEDGGKQ